MRVKHKVGSWLSPQSLMLAVTAAQQARWRLRSADQPSAETWTVTACRTMVNSACTQQSASAFASAAAVPPSMYAHRDECARLTSSVPLHRCDGPLLGPHRLRTPDLMKQLVTRAQKNFDDHGRIPSVGIGWATQQALQGDGGIHPPHAVIAAQAPSILASWSQGAVCIRQKPLLRGAPGRMPAY